MNSILHLNTFSIVNTGLNLKLLESKLELHFQVKGIDIEIINKNDYLQVLLESEDTPEKKACLSLIEQILLDSQESKIDIIKVYGRKKHEYSPGWIENIVVNREINLSLKLLESKLELYFQVKEIDIKITNKDNHLQVLLESENIPKRKDCLLLIKQILRESQEKELDKIKVYGQKKSEDFPEWVDEVVIDRKTKVDLTELAQKKNPDSIIAVLNRDLDLNSISVKAGWKDDCLRIMLVAEQKLDRDFALTIKNKIWELNLENCQTIKICSQQIDDDFPDWLEVFCCEKLKSAEADCKSTINDATETKLGLAKQGDSNAIAYCLNYILQKRQIIATVIINNNWLEVTLQGNKPPERNFLVPYITNFVHKLELTWIDTLQIQALQMGSTVQSWSETIPLV